MNEYDQQSIRSPEMDDPIGLICCGTASKSPLSFPISARGIYRHSAVLTTYYRNRMVLAKEK